MEFKYMIKGTEQIEHSPIEFFSEKGSAFFLKLYFIIH